MRRRHWAHPIIVTYSMYAIECSGLAPPNKHMGFFQKDIAGTYGEGPREDIEHFLHSTYTSLDETTWGWTCLADTQTQVTHMLRKNTHF